MAHALRSTSQPRSALTIPTPHETALFLLEPHRESPEIMEEWDEEGDLTFVKYYSPTSD
jgi:hypothetical protein